MLTKSDLQAYLQCKRKLWLDRHKPDLADANNSSMRRRTLDGNWVGEKAREELGKNVLWPPGGTDRAQVAARAKELVERSPDLSVVEMPMAFGGVYARADALVRRKSSYVLRETKASSFPSRTIRKRQRGPRRIIWMMSPFRLGS